MTELTHDEWMDAKRARQIAHRSWKWGDRDRFRWKGIWFHYHPDHMAYIGTIRFQTANHSETFARFTVRRDHNQSWFARVWSKGPRGRDDIVGTAIDDRPNASPPGALKSVSAAVFRESARLYDKAMDARFLTEVIGDIRWGERGRRSG